MTVYFFGCWGEPGHYLYTPDGRIDWDGRTPWGKTPDGTLLPHTNPSCRAAIEPAYCQCHPREEGAAKLSKKDGWTAIGFPDYSGDSRGGSNSNFLAEGDFTFEEMLDIANQYFPDIMRRIHFQIRKVQ